VLELHPITVQYPVDGGDPQPTKSLEAHIVDVVTNVAKAGVARVPFAWDVPAWSIKDGERCANGVHPVSRLFDECRAAGNMPVVPVITLARDTNFRHAVRDVIAKDGRGVVIRLKPTEFPRVMLQRGLRALLRDLGVKPNQVDLVIDIEYITMSATNQRVDDTVALMQSIDVSGQPWRSCAVVAGAFPRALTALKRGVHRVMRWDLIFYRQLLARASELPFVPQFGDYGVAPPQDDALNANHRAVNPTPRIRLTSEQDWIIATGSPVDRSASAARAREYQYAARQLTALRDCASPSFSVGAHHVHGVALGQFKPGPAEAWRRHGTSHHITKVVEQLGRENDS
jgi:hypothetical protein